MAVYGRARTRSRGIIVEEHVAKIQSPKRADTKLVF